MNKQEHGLSNALRQIIREEVEEAINEKKRLLNPRAWESWCQDEDKQFENKLNQFLAKSGFEHGRTYNAMKERAKRYLCNPKGVK
jgi:hypothetical protein